MERGSVDAKFSDALMVSPHSLVEGLAPSRLPARKRRLAALCNKAVTEKRIFHFDATPLPLPMRRSATVDFYTAGSIFFLPEPDF
jgi:hypothetical protein